jgi:hypothetical protein
MIPQIRPDQMSPIQLEMLAREFDGDVSFTYHMCTMIFD